jgi:hypothetical protein
MSMVGFPLLLIPLAIYNIIVFLMPGVGFTDPLLQVRLVSGEFWAVSLGDMLVAFGVVLIWLEVVKAARPGGKYLTDHLLSLLVFGAAAAEFVMWPKFANSTFFMLALLTMVDFFSGIALRSKRGARARTVVAAAPAPTAIAPEPVTEHPAAPVMEPEEAVVAPESIRMTAAPEPVVEPAPVPAATSVAESVLLDHPGPKPGPAVTEFNAPSHEVVAPQPEIIAPVSSEAPSQHETSKP